MAKILITGGCGYISDHLIPCLIDKGHSVRLLDLPSRVEQYRLMVDSTCSVEFYSGDIRNREDVEKATDDIDIVFHLASKTSVVESMENVSFYTSHNVLGTSVLSEVARGKVNRVILSSSRAVYGEGVGYCSDCGRVNLSPRKKIDLCQGLWEPRCAVCQAGIESILPCREDDQPSPTSIYGGSKKAQEEILSVTLHNSTTDLVILRYFNVYGSARKFKNRIPSAANTFAGQALKQMPFTFFEDGNQIRDFVNIEDVTQANLLAISADPGIYNVGSGDQVSLAQFSFEIADLIGYKPEVSYFAESRAGDIRHSVADLSHVQKHLKWKPQTSLREGISNLLYWMQEAKEESLIN